MTLASGKKGKRVKGKDKDKKDSTTAAALIRSRPYSNAELTSNQLERLKTGFRFVKEFHPLTWKKLLAQFANEKVLEQHVRRLEVMCYSYFRLLQDSPELRSDTGMQAKLVQFLWETCEGKRGDDKEHQDILTPDQHTQWEHVFISLTYRDFNYLKQSVCFLGHTWTFPRTPRELFLFQWWLTLTEERQQEMAVAVIENKLKDDLNKAKCCAAGLHGMMFNEKRWDKLKKSTRLYFQRAALLVQLNPQSLFKFTLYPEDISPSEPGVFDPRKLDKYYECGDGIDVELSKNAEPHVANHIFVRVMQLLLQELDSYVTDPHIHEQCFNPKCPHHRANRPFPRIPLPETTTAPTSPSPSLQEAIKAYADGQPHLEEAARRELASKLVEACVTGSLLDWPDLARMTPSSLSSTPSGIAEELLTHLRKMEPPRPSQDGEDEADSGPTSSSSRCAPQPSESPKIRQDRQDTSTTAVSMASGDCEGMSSSMSMSMEPPVAGAREGEEGGEEQRYMRCVGCRYATYCSRECQREHWASHKKECVHPEYRHPPASTIDYLQDSWVKDGDMPSKLCHWGPDWNGPRYLEGRDRERDRAAFQLYPDNYHGRAPRTQYFAAPSTEWNPHLISQLKAEYPSLCAPESAFSQLDEAGSRLREPKVILINSQEPHFGNFGAMNIYNLLNQGQNPYFGSPFGMGSPVFLQSFQPYHSSMAAAAAPSFRSGESARIESADDSDTEGGGEYTLPIGRSNKFLDALEAIDKEGGGGGSPTGVEGDKEDSPTSVPSRTPPPEASPSSPPAEQEPATGSGTSKSKNHHRKRPKRELPRIPPRITSQLTTLSRRRVKEEREARQRQLEQEQQQQEAVMASQEVSVSVSRSEAAEADEAAEGDQAAAAPSASASPPCEREEATSTPTPNHTSNEPVAAPVSQEEEPEQQPSEEPSSPAPPPASDSQPAEAPPCRSQEPPCPIPPSSVDAAAPEAPARTKDGGRAAPDAEGEGDIDNVADVADADTDYATETASGDKGVAGSNKGVRVERVNGMSGSESDDLVDRDGDGRESEKSPQLSEDLVDLPSPIHQQPKTSPPPPPPPHPHLPPTISSLCHDDTRSAPPPLDDLPDNTDGPSDADIIAPWQTAGEVEGEGEGQEDDQEDTSPSSAADNTMALVGVDSATVSDDRMSPASTTPSAAVGNGVGGVGMGMGGKEPRRKWWELMEEEEEDEDF
ncbi:unnamed protein product [Vitrella brassicaformis CCMP3155]|uniref:MYND-type domain-containing protein n=2 Tax=Vitrella brassicaformis TaxID=1169539 RepID=A0A0G4GLW3_VITBC|nr:unnamed protein product [Vitrella brassicaformis CCMP3155]|eukprot:CEM31114.1 unnamed protein product [Vitrella brassicaformis CCMP3155]